MLSKETCCEWRVPHYMFEVLLSQGCTTCGPRRPAGARGGPRARFIRPSTQFQKYKKLRVNDGNFVKEFKLPRASDNFTTYYNKSHNKSHYSTEGARWSSGINTTNDANRPGSRPVYYLSCSDLGQVVNLSLSVA